MTLTVGSLFTGVDGIGTGLELAGWPVERAWFVENDPAPSKVLAHHWPTVPNLGDITAVDWDTQPDVDVVASSWPCQGNSLAGKRRGRGDHWNLWPETARCLEAKRPEWFVGENVPGLLTVEDGQAFGEVLADLDRLGYVTAWTTLGACKVGACHHRHRLFLLGRRTAGDAHRRAVGAGEPGPVRRTRNHRVARRRLAGRWEGVGTPR